MADIMSPAKRSALMARVGSANTGPERAIFKELNRLGLRYRKHVADLPGRPDVVFPRRRLAIFVEGDFWHGWRFPLWRARLPEFWQVKIEKNRKRDQRNMRKLRQAGWKVLRLWEHQIEASLDACVSRILVLLEIETTPSHQRTDTP